MISLFRSRLLPASLAAVVASSLPALANPGGGIVASGDVSFSGGAGGLTVTQGSRRAIINWNDFSIGAGEWTKFVLPDASSAVLNRVVTGAPSSLLGTLQSNGRVFLINPNGVLIGAQARIDVGGFLASTLDVADADFLQGADLHFRGAAAAAIQNLGRIDAGAGDVFLIARQVENAGAIRAGGTVAAAAGSEVLLTSDNHIFVQASSAPGSVVNSGQIDAARAELRAAGGNTGALAINNRGVIRATGSAERDGQVWLVASGGDTVSSGTLSAQSSDGQRGGEVRVLGDRVALLDQAVVDVSGARQGGTALIGGDFQGGNASIQNSTATRIAGAASIHADGADQGGRVIVWSDGSTRFSGTITAAGGGFVEVSGKRSLTFAGAVRTGGGTLLLDPTDIEVVDGFGFDGGGADLADGIWSTGEIGSMIGTMDIAEALASGSLVLQASNDIHWDPGATLDYAGIGSGKTLTLQAGNDIVFSGIIRDTNIGADRLHVIFNSDRDASGLGSITTDPGASIETNGGNLVFGGGLNPSVNPAYGTLPSHYRGIYLSGTTLSTGSGNLTLTGTGSPVGSGDLGIGVDAVSSSVIQSTTGTITINGIGATGGSANSYLGISIFNGSQVKTTAGGSIVMTGTAYATGTGNSGINLGTNASVQALAGGAITLSGTGSASGSGTSNIGLYIHDGSSVLGTGNTTIVLNATPGAGSSGIVTDTATNVLGNSVAGSFTGSLTLNTDSVAFSGATLNGSGALVIQPQTTSATIGLGDSASGTLNLSAAELAMLNHGFSSYTFGHSSGTGAIDVRGVTLAGPVTLRTPGAGGNITVNGALATTGGSAGAVSLYAGNKISLSSTGSITTSAAPVLLNADRDANGSGNITLDSASITTNGGDITLRGGNAVLGALTAPTTDAAAFLASLQATAARGDGLGDTGVLMMNSSINAGGGNIDVRGTGGSGFRGVQVDGSSVTTSGAGLISLYGAGGAAGDLNMGVDVTGSPGTVSTANGTLTVYGLGRGASTSPGVIVQGSGASLQSVNGAIVVRGVSQGTGTGDQGVDITTSGLVRTTGTGDIDMIGRGSGTGGGVGVYAEFSSILQTAGGGNISLTGYGSTIGVNNNNEGVKLYSGSLVEIQTGANRTLSLNGTGGTGQSYNIGVNVLGSTARMGASTTGQLVVTGVGGNGSVTGNWGVLAEGNGVYESLGASSITFNGTGGTGTDNYGIKHTGGTNVIGSGSMTGAINFNADTIDLIGFGGSITVRSSGALNIQPLSAGTTIGVGTGAAGTLSLDSAEIARLADGFSSINIGRADGTGTITVGAATFTDPLKLINTGAGAGGVSLQGAFSTGSNSLTLASAGPVTQSVAFTAGQLALTGSGNITLTHASNAIGSVAANTSGNLSVTSGAGLTVGSVDGIDGVTSSGAGITLRTTAGALTLNRAVTSTATGDVNLVSGGTFINNVGSSAIAAPLAHWFVWSGTPADDTRGGLSPDFKQYNATYGVTSVAGTGNGLLYSVAPTVTVGLQGSVSREYDASLAAALSAGNFSLSGAIDGDTVTYSVGATAFADKNVGSGKQVTATGLALTDATNGAMPVYGYQLASTSASGAIGTITARTLSLTGIGAVSRQYDGSTIAALDWSGLSLSGVAGTDSLTLGFGSATGAFANKDVGTGKTVTITGVSLSGPDAGNYTLSTAPAVADIHPRTLTVTLTGTSQKTYDGTAGATLDASNYVLNGVVGSEAVSLVAPTSGTLADRNAGSGKAIDVTGLSLSGADAGNYSLGSTSVSGNIGVVTPKDLTVTGTDASVTYGAATPSLTATFSGFAPGEDASNLGGSLNVSTPANSGSGVGSYAVTPAGLSSSNYAITYVPGTLSIAPADLTVTANDATKLYGAVLPNFSASFGGLVNSDPSTVVTGLLFSTSAGASSPVGTYAIVPYNGSAANYALNYVNGTLTINPAPLLVVVNDTSRLYGSANPAFSTGISGFVLGEDASVLSGTLAYQTPAGASSDVGSYAVTASGLASTNYTISYAPGSLAVLPAPLTITADNVSRVYGDANPAFTASYSGFVLGQDASVLGGSLLFTTPANQASHVGAYAVTPSGLTSGNYGLSFGGGQLTVSPAPLTISASAASSVYGSALPALGATFTGLKNGDTSAVVSGLVLGTTATSASPVGTYTVSATGGTASDYILTRTNGLLTVTPAALTVRADDQSRTYGSANPAFTATISGLVNGDSASVLSGLTFSTTATPSSGVGSYAIVPSGGASSNYVITYADGVLSVARQSLLITADDAVRTYGAANPTFTATYLGLVGADTPSVVSGLQFSTTATVGSAVGTYAITPFGASAANYEVRYASGTLTIRPADLVITANDSSRLFGAADPVFTARFDGLLLGDTSDVVSGLVFETDAVKGSPIGRYDIRVGGGAAQNYRLQFRPGTLSVSGAVVDVDEVGSVIVASAGDRPALSSQYAVVNLDGRPSLLSLSAGGGASSVAGSSVDQQFQAQLSHSASANGSGLGASGSLTTATVSASAPAPSAGTISAPDTAEDLVQESSLNQGRFAVVYREDLATLRAVREGRAAGSSSYRAFDSSERAQTTITRSPARATQSGSSTEAAQPHAF